MPDPQTADIRIGCCGFATGQNAYRRRFSLVEVQQTFYQPPRIATLEKWRREAPAGFEFTLKAWQLITHEPSSPTYRRLRPPIAQHRAGRYGGFKPTREVMDAWRVTLDAARALRASVILFQCPASFTPAPEHIRSMQKFFREIVKDCGGLALAWEPRGPWLAEVVQSLCAEFGLIHAVDPFKDVSLAGRCRYFRMHGVSGYRYRYTNADFKRLAGWCQETTYCLFNNMTMLQDALRFMRTVKTVAQPAP